MKYLSDPAVRHYIYSLVCAGIPLLVVFGLVAQDQVQLWLMFAAAALGLGSAALARPNTPVDSRSAVEATDEAPKHRAEDA